MNDKLVLLFFEQHPTLGLIPEVGYVGAGGYLTEVCFEICYGTTLYRHNNGSGPMFNSENPLVIGQTYQNGQPTEQLYYVYDPAILPCVKVSGQARALALEEIPAMYRSWAKIEDAIPEHDGWFLYCSICNEYQLHTNLCEHIWECEECEWFSTPDERCDH